MIHIERGPTPPILKSPKFVASYKRIKLAIRAGDDWRQGNLLSPLKDCKQLLKVLFRSKCAYCETHVAISSEGDFEHFRPKADAMNLDGSVSPTHYWWLTLEWTNMLFSCQICNRTYKARRFPIAGARASEETFGADLLKERPLLIDPCHDIEPIERNLLFAEDGTVISDTERGHVTIDTLGLNRTELVHARSAKVHYLRILWENLRGAKAKALQRSIADIHAELSPEKPYLGIARQFMRTWLQGSHKFATASTAAIVRRSLLPLFGSDAGLAEATRTAAAVKQTRKSWEVRERAFEDYSLQAVWGKGGRVNRKILEDYFRKRRLIQHVEIHNYRGIPHLEVDFPEASHASAWMMFLGENGTGKSSILHGIAVALMGNEERRKLKITPESVLREGAKSGWVRVRLTNVLEPVFLEFKQNSGDFSGNAIEPKVLLLGYGATRLLPRSEVGSTGSPIFKEGPIRVHNLLQKTFFLKDAAKWLGKLGSPEFERVKGALADLLFLRRGEGLIRYGREVRIRIGRREIPLNHLSDGFQCLVALATDIISVLDPLWIDALREAESVVLIDELDAHLHPRWRMEIVERLKKGFPRVQFIASTHDPLCLRGLRGGEVAVLRCTKANKLEMVANVPSPEGMSADQLLTSEHFGLSSTIDPSIERLFRKYYQLLARHALTIRQSAKLTEIKQKLDSLHHFGRTIRERIMLEAIDRYLATPARGVGQQMSQRESLDADLSRLWATDDPEGEISNRVISLRK